MRVPVLKRKALEQHLFTFFFLVTALAAIIFGLTLPSVPLSLSHDDDQDRTRDTIH